MFSTDEGGEYRTGSGKNIYYILNGERLILSPANTPVASEDRLLVYYGTGTFEEVLVNIYPQVAGNAKEYNEKQDPASCSQNANTSLLDGTTEKLEGIIENLKEKIPHTHRAEDAH
jgi:hypothetical protein